MTSERMEDEFAAERVESAKPGGDDFNDELAEPEEEIAASLDGAEEAEDRADDAHRGKPPEPIVMKQKRIRLPGLPPNLDEAVWAGGVTLTTVSINHPIMNVSATLVFTLDTPHFDDDLQGEHAFTLGFLNGLLGEGGQVRKVESVTDDENRVTKKITVRVPRFRDESTDQILACIAPLIGGKSKIEGLMSSDGTWGLNFRSVGIKGMLSLYAMQQSFDLTSPVPDPSITREPV